ncbi:hypothetical protein LTR97_008271 [Elasticomyces elasticus]|uniref:C2H2-type domain-containing protein n=1 Tax=Elasticomyces elasticus TaxID=574655 RepID=A0AAN7ZME8_9PEZI|nr:hypothetical protein LTR97_008271 [Elasticomyces elasticus]KAK5719169.1 hypothetical protein LTR15_007692 [Elasticomyces elasticus]
MRLGKAGLLEYNAEHRILICRECQYAIQKNAIESHLLRQHQVYRSDRKKLLAAIGELDVQEPENVSSPDAGSLPVQGLPTMSGYRCTATDCQHLTVSTKRMQRHWTEKHRPGEGETFLLSAMRPAALQTFFRGTKIRYFEVTSAQAPLANDVVDTSQTPDDSEQLLHLDGRSLHMDSPAPSLAQPRPTSFISSELVTLTYFHHFTSVTASVLPSVSTWQQGTSYWLDVVVPSALQDFPLMCGLLALAAYHKAALASKSAHQEQAAHYSDVFFTQPAAADAVTVRDAKLMIGCLLQCLRGRLKLASLSEEAYAHGQAQAMLTSLRCCACLHNPDSGGDGPSITWVGVTGPAITERLSRTQSVSSSDTTSMLVQRLRTLPYRMAETLERPDNAQDVVTTLSAIVTLVECYEESFTADCAAAAWQAVVTWVMNVSDRFVELVMQSDIAATVVVAHWAAILVRRAELVGCWWLTGSSEEMMLQIATQLAGGDGRALCLLDGLKVGVAS